MDSYRSRQVLARLLAEAPSSTADLPARLVSWCSTVLPVSGVALVLMARNQPAGTVAASDDVATSLEELQFTLGEGPCVESTVTGRAVLVPDLAADAAHRWPAFAAGALDAGARAVFTLPLRVGEIRLGVLDLYRDTTGPLVDGDLAEALSFADAATAVLLHLQEQALEVDRADHAPPALGLEDRRAVVHQATGVLAVQTGLELSSALVLLRARAHTLGRPVVEVARGVVDGTLDVRTPGP